MKLTAPVNNIESCIAQIDSGADEIYLGYRVDFFKRISFSARPQIKKGEYLLVDKAQFSEIVNYASQRGRRVFLTANTQFFSDYPVEGISIEDEFLQYVNYGMECGVDAVIVSDIGLMSAINTKIRGVPIISSTLVDVDNLYQIKFLKSLGVKRVVLSYQITMPEIRRLCHQEDIELEVFAYGGCSFATNCMLGHGERFQIPCENTYTSKKNPNMASQSICSAYNCSLCSVWDLLQNNITAIKVQGRERDYRKVIPLTKMFRSAIDLASQSTSKIEYMDGIKDLIPIWWKKIFCERRQCKFENHFCDISISNINMM
ncbi:MAG: U32 family peptidase [Bacteroidales bacterium]|nr:U32 family peptidase [Bacteroidales bacterium]